MRNKFADTLYKSAKKNKKIFALVADISPAGSMIKFQKENPDRFINCGVAEQSMIGISAGLAMRGMRPFCYTIATFSIFRPYEFIRVDLCYQNLPVTVIGMGAGLVYSNLGSTHHSMEDIGLARSLPNMIVLAPCDPREMEEATKWCINRKKSPVYMRLGKAGEPDLTKKAIEKFEFGRIRMLTRGKDIAILSYGTLINKSFIISEKLKKIGITSSIYSCHTLKPFNYKDLKKILRKYKNIVVLEEHVPQGGLCTLVKEGLNRNNSNSNSILFYSIKDKFIHFYGSHDQLLSMHGINVDKIFRDIKKMIK